MYKDILLGIVVHNKNINKLGHEINNKLLIIFFIFTLRMLSKNALWITKKYFMWLYWLDVRIIFTSFFIKKEKGYSKKIRFIR